MMVAAKKHKSHKNDSGFKKYEKNLSVQIEATVEHDILLQPVPLTESVCKILIRKKSV